jgi:hypothetical protein
MRGAAVAVEDGSDEREESGEGASELQGDGEQGPHGPAARGGLRGE